MPLKFAGRIAEWLNAVRQTRFEPGAAGVVLRRSPSVQADVSKYRSIRRALRTWDQPT